MQLANAYVPQNTQLSTTIWAGLIAILAGLLSDVVASHLAPALEQRTWLAVSLFALVSLTGIWLTIYREYGAWIPLPSLVPALDQATHRQLLTILLPLTEHEEDRRALMRLALDNDAAYDRITFTGPNESFLSNMLDVLVRRGEIAPGKQALWALLEVVYARVGLDQQARINALRSDVAALSQRRQFTLRQALLDVAKLLRRKLKPVPLAIFLALAVLVGVGSPLITKVYAKAVPYCLPDHVCVFVAQFTPVGKQDATTITDNIYAELSSVLQTTVPERFTLHKVVLAEEAQANETPEQTVARLARERGALLIVWGDVYSGTNSQTITNVRFHLADLMGVGEASAAQPYRAVPLHYDALNRPCSDCLFLQSSQQAQIITYATAGLFHYMRHRPRIARHAFEAALYCADQLDRVALGDIVPTCTPSRPASDWNPSLFYYYRGKAFYQEGDFPNARANLELAAKDNPHDPAALIGIAVVYQGWLGSGRESDPLVKQELAKAKVRAMTLLTNTTMLAPSVLYNLGFIHELAGTDAYAEAQKWYRAAADEFSSDEFRRQGQSPYVSLIALARVQQKAGNRDAARITLQEAIDVDPNLAWAYIGMAQTYEDDPPTATTWLSKAQDRVDIFDGAVDLAEAGLCQSEKWQDDKCAAEAFQRVLEKWRYSGNLYSLAGDFYRRAAERGIEKGHNDVPANWENARENYAKAAEQLRPNDPWIHERLAYVLFQQGDYVGAAGQYEQAVALAYNAPDPIYVPDGVYCMMAFAQENANKFAHAVESYRYCMELTADPMRKQAAEERIEQLERTLKK